MSAIATTIRRSFCKASRLTVITGIALTAGSILSGAGTAKPTAASNAKPHRWFQIGRASWYGKYFQGHATASGENYDMNSLTCAHRSLPLGTLLRVTNLRNHKAVVVRVNDRGPMAKSMLVDLSVAAANFIGIGGRGTAPVRIDVVDPSSAVAQMQWPLGDSALPGLTLR